MKVNGREFPEGSEVYFDPRNEGVFGNRTRMVRTPDMRWHVVYTNGNAVRESKKTTLRTDVLRRCES